MVVDQVDVNHVCSFEPEDDSPVARNPDRPKLAQVSSQTVEPPSGNSHHFGAGGLIQALEDAFDSGQLRRREQAAIASLVEASQTAVAEASNHKADLSSLLISGGGLEVGDGESLNPQSVRALSRLREVVAGLEREPDAIAAAERHV